MTVPNVYGDTADVAQQILQGDGFTVTAKTVTGSAGSTPGDVFATNPSAGTSVARGSAVTIYVAAQSPSPTASPTPSATPTTSSPTPTPSDGGGPGGNGNGNGNGGGGGGGN